MNLLFHLAAVRSVPNFLPSLVTSPLVVAGALSRLTSISFALEPAASLMRPAKGSNEA